MDGIEEVEFRADRRKEVGIFKHLMRCPGIDKDSRRVQRSNEDEEPLFTIEPTLRHFQGFSFYVLAWFSSSKMFAGIYSDLFWIESDDSARTRCQLSLPAFLILRFFGDGAELRRLQLQ